MFVLLGIVNINQKLLLPRMTYIIFRISGEHNKVSRFLIEELWNRLAYLLTAHHY